MIDSKRRPLRHRPGNGVLSISPLLALLALGTAVMALAAPGGQAASLRDGVLVAPARGLAYVMRPGGGIDAIDLSSGAVRWHSDAATKPLAISGKQLVAQAESKGGTLDIVALDAQLGARGASSRVPLPAGVRASVVDNARGSFRVYADSAGSQITLQWEATAYSNPAAAQGFMPAANVGQPPARNGSVVLTAGDDALALQAPSADSKAEVSRATLQELTTPLAKAVPGRQFLSADGRHVLVSQMKTGGRQPLDLYSRRWTIYDRETGAELGSVPALTAASPFLVRGTTLIHVAPAFAAQRDGEIMNRPATLRAVDLRTGNELWKVAVRDTSFRGPFPP